MAVVKTVAIKYASIGVSGVQQAYGKVQTGLIRTGNAAKRSTEATAKWMKANSTALLAMAGAAAGFLGALVAASPSVSGMLSGIRVAFSLFAESVFQAFGSDTVASIVDFSFKMVDAFDQMNPGLKKFISILIVAVPAIAAVSLAVLGLALAVSAIGVATLVTIGVIAAVVVALVAVIAVIVLIAKNWDLLWSRFLGGLKIIWQALVSTLKSAAEKVWGFIQELGAAFMRGLETVAAWVQSVWDELVALASRAYTWGRDLVKNMIDGILSMARQVKKAIDKILEPITFDIAANDAMAKRWGSDLAMHFNKGVSSGIKGPGLGGAITPAPVSGNSASVGRGGVTVVIQEGAIKFDGNGGTGMSDGLTSSRINELAEAVGRIINRQVGAGSAR